ncbi:MAG TPA: DegT/DnrJ/EryC1/StrS family aminotransferase [Pseudolabrys sp.]|nr:DegT/DnrJ/EryC1/StrS family aminotransferase [Pseudolabrys sp.]
MTRIPIAGPSITQKEVDYVTEAVKSAWYDTANIFHERFEQAFAAHCGRKFAISLPSCTSGLHLALLALGIGQGDEVIVPDCTWIASVAPVRYVGATPVFADLDSDSWCLSADAFEASITPRTRAAIVVDLYGAMPDWDRISEVANRHNVVLIEDAAEAIGSRWRERRAGSFGVMSAFSFHGSKTLTTGEGGMLVLDDDHLRTRVMKLRDHGRVPGDTMFFNEEVGWKYKMSSMQAALGLAQLERVDELVAKKRQIFSWYRKALADWNLGSLNPDVPGLFNSYWMTTVLLDAALGIKKETLVPRLRQRGVDVRPFFYPLSAIPAFRDSPEAAKAQKANTVAYSVSPYALNLPSALSLDEDLIGKVSVTLRREVGVLRQTA